jgi:hypothetical protein
MMSSWKPLMLHREEKSETASTRQQFADGQSNFKSKTEKRNGDHEMLNPGFGKRDARTDSGRISCVARLLVAVLLFAGSHGILHAQLFAGSVVGIVQDADGRIIPNAGVRVINNATREERHFITDNDGHYAVNQLNPGDYTLSVDSAGFKSVKQSFHLEASQNLRLDETLSVGSTTEAVVVTSQIPLLDVEDANKNITLSGTGIKELPLPTHGALAAVWSPAGVVAIRAGQGLNATSGDGNTDRFSLNGGRDESAAILVDGVSVTAGDWGGAMGLPSSESIREFQVFKSAFDVQYGKTDGGVVSITTQGGSQSFHGGGFEHYQNGIFNANSWADKDVTPILARPSYQSNFYGVHVGGPIWRNKKIFFFTNYERVRQTAPSNFLGTVPTALERGGDFSQTYDYVNGVATQPTVYDPFSAGAGTAPYTRTAFPGNKINIPFDPVGQKMVNLFPLPNITATNGVNNFAATGTSGTQIDRLDGRVDYVLTSKIAVFGTFMKLWNSQTVPVFLGPGLDTNDAQVDPYYRGLMSATYVPSSTLVVNAVGAFSTWHQFQISPSETAHINASTYGLPASLVSTLSTDTLPAVSFQNYSTLGNARHLNYTLHNFDGQLNISKVIGQHTIRAGFQATIQQLNDDDETSGTFAFTRALTAGPNAPTSSTTSGNAIASALLGAYSSGSANVAVAPAAEQRYISWYGEDTWKLGARLSLTYGLRYDIQTPRTERFNRYNHFDPNVVSPLAAETGLPVTGGLVFSSPSSRGMWSTQYKNFAPRMGFAYQAEKNVTLRGGYGLFFLQAITSAPTTPTDGFSVTNTAIATVNNTGYAPNTLISNPFPSGLAAPVGSSEGLLTDVGTSVNAFLYQKVTPYVQTYSLDTQIQITPSSVFELGYAGSQGRQLAVGYALNANQLDPKYLSMGAALNQAVPNPFYGVITTGANATATVPRYKLLLPHPQFTNVSLPMDLPKAASNYNALTTKYTQRYGRNLTTILTYQWSKAIDNTSETQGWETGDLARDAYDLSLERSVSAHDVPQYFTGTVIWSLPVGRGRLIGGGMNRFVNGAIGGWEVSTITAFSSGLPYQFSCSNALSSFGYSVCRPNVTDITQLALPHRTTHEWFNTTVLSNPSNTTVPSAPVYGIGNIPRYTSNVRLGGVHRADITLRKRFNLPRETNFSVEATGYNVSNTPQYGEANTSLGSSTFGQVTSLAAGSNPRTVEFTGRYTF